MNKTLAHELLEHLVICGSRLVVSSLFVPYGQSLGRALREIEREQARCTHSFARHSRETVSVALSRMKKQDLVSMSGPKKKAVWRITRKGKNHFQKIGREKFVLPPEDGKTRIVMFDIPEKRKAERDWLRTELLSCDFSPLQKSVFMGMRPLPANLLKELRNRNLISYVHVVGLEH